MFVFVFNLVWPFLLIGLICHLCGGVKDVLEAGRVRLRRWIMKDETKNINN